MKTGKKGGQKESENNVETKETAECCHFQRPSDTSSILGVADKSDIGCLQNIILKYFDLDYFGLIYIYLFPFFLFCASAHFFFFLYFIFVSFVCFRPSQSVSISISRTSLYNPSLM